MPEGNNVISLGDWIQIAVVVVTTLGWFVVFYLGKRQQRAGTKEEMRLKVYEEFWKQRSQLQDSINQLGTMVLTSVPFELMEAATILGETTKIEVHIRQGEQGALTHLRDYIDRLLDAQRNFETRLLEFVRSLEMWIHVVPELETAKSSFISEYWATQQRAADFVSGILSLSRSDWRSWSREQMKGEAETVSSEILRLGFYVEDMMGLIHNELLEPLFKHPKRERHPLDPHEKVLTREGLKRIPEA
jgi:hypothetical protein